MKTKSLISVVVGLVVLGILTLASCSSERGHSEVSRELSEVSKTPGQFHGAARGPKRGSCRIKVDLERFYQSCLKKDGVNDFSTESLIKLLGSEISTIRFFSASLLGERKEVSAIPRLEAALQDESLPVQVAVTTGLLKMGNRKGIKVLETFCEKASKEFDQCDGQHDGELAVDLMDAAKVLADAGEVSAIPHLRKLLKYDKSWGVRITALRSLRKLYEKDATVLTDIASMLDDEHPQVREEASIFLLYSPPAAVETLGLDVVSRRPMGEAVIALAEQLGCIITYEDPPFQNVSELSPIYPGAKVFIPKPEKISYDYERTKSDGEIILGLINKYNETGHAREFTFVKMGEIYNVFPSRYLNSEGQVLNHRSVLNIKTSLSLRDSNLWSAIEELRSAVSQSDPNYRIILGNVPRGAFLRIPFSIEINNAKLMDVLNEILSTFNRNYDGYAGADKRWIWQLRHCPKCDDDDNAKLIYGINFRTISDAHPDFMKIRVTHQRPMATAAKIFEKRLRSIITYEGPPYSCSWDIMGDANEKNLAGGIITMDWKSGSSADEVLNSLVNTPIRPRENIGTFDITKGNGAYHIHPILSRDEQCNLVSQKSIMSEQITINAKNIDGLTFVESVCSKLSEQTNEKVALGPVPDNLSEMLRKHRSPRISISNQKARDCLGQFLWKINGDISWQLLFDPSLKHYRLFLYNSSE